MLNFGCLGWVVGLVLFLQCFFFVAHAGLKPLILLPQPLKRLDYKHAPPYPTLRFHVLVRYKEL